MLNSSKPLLIVMTNKPSEGMEKWFLKVLHDECKIQITDCKFVYMLNEPPKGQGNKPTKAQMKESFERFQREVQESKPEVVLVLGGEELYYLTGIREHIDSTRGYILTKKYFRNIDWQVKTEIGKYKTNNKNKGIKVGDARFGMVTQSFPGLLGDFDGVVISTYTLNHLRLSGFSVKPAFKEDILRVSRALDGTLRPIDQKFSYYTELTSNQLSFNDVISVDIETHGINNEVIDRVSISDGEVSASLEWSSKAIHLLNDIFSHPSVLVAVHNSPFDIPRLQANGVNITEKFLNTQVFDTMFAAVTLQPDLRKGLGQCVTVYLDCEPWKWRSLSEADPIYYSAKDAFMTTWLAKQEIRVMKDLGLWNLFMGKQNHPGPGIMATIPVLTELNRTGLRTDRVYATQWVEKLKRRQLRYEKLWARQFTLNPHSTKQVQELLYSKWELPIQKNKEGRTSADELALVKLRAYIQSDYAEVHDAGAWKTDSQCTPRFFDLLLVLRDVSKTISTYVQPVAESQSTWVYPYYLPISKDDETTRGKKMMNKGNTSTGRLATYDPNIGNQPKKVRQIYVPDNDENCFIEGDWKAAELCVFAHCSGDRRLIDDLRSDDLHQRNAERFGIDRDTAKNVIYASQYLAGPSKVNEMILEQTHKYVPVEECRRIMKGLEAYYTDVTAYKRYLADLCHTQGYIRNPFGRVRIFHEDNAPAAVDFMAQSTVADCLWCIMLQVSILAEVLKGRFTTTVYDSILIQVPEKNRERAISGLKDIMERKFDIVAPNFFIPAEIKVGEPGKSWGELKKYDLSKVS